MYSLMIHGIKGTRIKKLVKYFDESDTRSRYFYVLKKVDKSEERLALWLALPENEKLKMLCH